MSKGKLIISGGNEDEEGEQTILKEVIHLTGDGTLLLMTVASKQPEKQAAGYKRLFKQLGLENVDWLNIKARDDGLARENIDKVKQASLLFFTGGDQLRITSQIGDTPVYSTIHERFQKGMHVFGTSAGAAVMPETMLVSGNGDESNHMNSLSMAPGLGLIKGVVTDSHFAERGHIGRLLGAVAQNPTNLGLGIDENTAIIVNRSNEFRVIGDGAVYVLDGQSMTYSSLSEERSDDILTVYDLKLHVLAEGQKFDLRDRKPIRDEGEEKTRESFRT